MTALLTLSAGCVSLYAGRSSTSLDGALWWVTPDDAAMSSKRWAAELGALDELGIDTLILNGPYVGAPLESNQPDTIDSLFTLADRRRINVYLDTLAAPEWWTLSEHSMELERARARVDLLLERYGHHTSFKGFYIPYEVYVMWDDQRELIQTLYREVSNYCRDRAPDKKILISPFFILDQEGILGDFRWASPDEFEAFWRETLVSTQIDYVALQDSGEHLSYYTLDQRRPFFEAMSRACAATGAELWANVELGELEVSGPEEYVRRFGMKTHVNDPRTADAWRAVPAEKFVAKHRMAGEYASKSITWGYREYARPSQGPEAWQVHEDLRRALRPNRPTMNLGFEWNIGL